MIKSQKLEIRKLGQALSRGEPPLPLWEMGVWRPHSSQNSDAEGTKRHEMTFPQGRLVLVDHGLDLAELLLKTRERWRCGSGDGGHTVTPAPAESSRFVLMHFTKEVQQHPEGELIGARVGESQAH